MWLLYGANGYTGELIAKLAKARGESPVLAGRNAEAVARIAGPLGFAHRAFGLDDPAAVDAGLDGAKLVLHCAGPFSRTSAPMVDACLRRGIHYLDITGEIAVFEACAARTDEARARNVMLMPGVGFDVVPTDCLAAHLKRRLPSATHLALGLLALGNPSRGTATTVVEHVGDGGLVRQDGALTPVAAAHKSRTIDFGKGPREAICIPWGDVSTAYHSTKIPNIEVYLAAPPMMRLGAKLAGVFGPLLATAPAQKLIKAAIGARPAGPSDEERARGKSFVWCEATDGTRTVVSRLETPEGYTFTADSALAIAKRVHGGDAPVGYQTPSSAYGPDFVLSLENVTRSDD
jgi:short subunit dehydrogenase-like uncharacterized protein